MFKQLEKRFDFSRDYSIPFQLDSWKYNDNWSFVFQILEEVGYDVAISRIEKIFTFHEDVGTHGPTQTLFFAEVRDEDRKNHGGGVDDEMIEVVEYTIDEIRQIIATGCISSPPCFLLGVQWFLSNRADKYK